MKRKPSVQISGNSGWTLETYRNSSEVTRLSMNQEMEASLISVLRYKASPHLIWIAPISYSLYRIYEAQIVLFHWNIGEEQKRKIADISLCARNFKRCCTSITSFNLRKIFITWIIMPYFRGNWHFQRLGNVSMVFKLASSRTSQTPLVRLSPLTLHWECYCYIHVAKINSHSLVLMLSSHQYLLHFFPLLSSGLITAVTFQIISRLYFYSLYYPPLAAITNYHICSSLNQHLPFWRSDIEMGLTRRKSLCQQGHIPSWSSRWKSVALPFSASGQGPFPAFLDYDSAPCLQSQQHNIFRSLALLPPSFTDKEGWDYIGPTRIIQANLPIWRSLTSHIFKSLFPDISFTCSFPHHMCCCFSISFASLFVLRSPQIGMTQGSGFRPLFLCLLTHLKISLLISTVI